MAEVESMRIFYLTAGERKAGMIFEALAVHYPDVTVAYEHGRDFVFRTSINKIHQIRTFKLPRLPRYVQLIYQWGRVAEYLLRNTHKNPYDLCVSEGIQFSLVLRVFRWMRVFRRTCYYAQDWFPDHLILNYCDRICYLGADHVWDMTPCITKGRADRWSNYLRRQIEWIEPLYAPPEKFAKLPIKESLRVCYVGGLRRDVGIDLLLKSISKCAFKGLKIYFDIIGKEIDSGCQEDLRNLTQQLSLESNVVFHGFINTKNMLNIISEADCGVALFTGGKKNYSNWAIIGKVREYLENGLAVLISKENPSADEIVARGAGIAVADSVDEITNALLKLINNSADLLTMKESAHRMATEKSDPQRLYDAIDLALKDSALECEN